MDTKQPLSLFLVAILVASVFTVIGISSITAQNASAQAVTIETSVDDHGMRFWGNSVVQVIIEDNSADSDSNDTISVTVDADGDTADSLTFSVPNTFEGSQIFEFFMMHTSSTFDIDTLDPDNNDLAEFRNGTAMTGAGTNPSPIVTFGSGSTDLDTGAGTFDEVTLDIEFESELVTVDYEDTIGQLTIDRAVYGSTSIVYVTINDQDGNLNPTGDDDFTVLLADLPDLFELEGATFDNTFIFEETGDNSAIFEYEAHLGGNITLDAGNESVTLRLNDKEDYFDVNSAVSNTTNTDTVTFTVDDVDGDFDDIPTLTFGGELVLMLNDNDQNIDSDDDDNMDNVAGGVDGNVTVTVDGVAGADSEVVPMEETGDNTGVFDIDLSNGELPITFLALGQTPTANNGILELRRTAVINDITEDIIVSYGDPLNDDSAAEVTAEFSLEIDLVDGAVNLPDTVGINDDFTFTLTDADLNNNPRSRDSYTFTLTGAQPAAGFALFRGGVSLINSATLEVDISPLAGAPTFADALAYTLLETGINTGIFEAELDMGAILDSAGAEVDDGDEVEITYNDLMDDSTSESSDSVSIGEADVGSEFSRSTVPIPPEAGTATEGLIGDTVVTTYSVTDPDENTDSGIENELEPNAGDGFTFETDAGPDDGPSFRVEVDGELDGEVASLADYAGLDLGGGTNLADIMPTLPSLTETGDNTGVFDDTLEFVNGGVTNDDWQDLELTFVYIDRNGDEESTGITFRGNDGIVTVDQSSAKAGTIMTITAQDEDLNLDDDEVEEFEACADDVTDDCLLTVETEDDQIVGVSTETFRETGVDTGVFTAEYQVGDDIPVSEEDGDTITQVTNILITYNDEIDSTGGGGDEFEINVPVASSTGSIQVSPQLVGPGTTLNVLIIDTDLDQDSSSTDEYNTPDPTGDNFFASFRSDRSEVEEASPNLDETGPNTGVFEFTIELETDEVACQDDDLDSADFNGVAVGGNEPSIGACPGDIVSITYEDEQNSNGQSTTISAIIEVNSWDPEFASDKDSYAVGDRATITISDPDANRNPDVADSLSDIRVWSDSDAVGDEFSALETGEETGVFTLSFLLSSGTESGAITVKNGDDVSIEYTDEFPADFVDNEEDKDFVFTVPIGAAEGGIGTTTAEAPTVQDSSGVELDDISAGQQVVLSTVIINNVDEPTPFTGLIEVRDSNDVTVYLAWQTGVLAASGQSEIGLSWTPENPGDYTVRTFVISDLDNPRVLSPVAETEITVS